MIVRGWSDALLVAACPVVAAIGLCCARSARDDAPPAPSLPAAPIASVVVATVPKYTRFKVTSAKPAEVEAALRGGWTLVNCSIASKSSGSMQYGVWIVGGEHCYLVGDEHALDVDAGGPGPSSADSTR